MGGVVAATERGNQLAVQKEQLNQSVIKFIPKFDAVVPPHLNGEMFAALATMTLRDRGIQEAAMNDPYAFISALLKCAQLGHQPGTPEFYLIPQSPRKGDPKKIVGWEGYRGLIQRMMRTDQVRKVSVEVVRQHDIFRYREGMPFPDFEWPSGFASEAERGDRIGVFAYAKIGDEYSRVIRLPKDKVLHYMSFSQSARSDFSPWAKHTDAMWMKTALKRLEPFVPVSSSWLAHMAQSAAKLEEIVAQEGLPPVLDDPEPPAVEGEIVEGDVWPETVPVAGGDRG